MAIDVFKETVINLTDATKRLPHVRKGKRIHVSCLWRWTVAGKKCRDGSTARLESIKIDGTTCTSLEALQRFFDRVTGDREVVTPPKLQERQRLQRAEEADRRLKEVFGI